MSWRQFDFPREAPMFNRFIERLQRFSDKARENGAIDVVD